MKKLLMLLVLGLLVSCGPDSDDVESLEEHVESMTFTMFSEDLNANYNNFNSEVAKEITRQTGVKLDIDYSSGTVEEELNIMLTSKDYPDLLMVKDSHLFVDAKAYVDLTELIETYAPNIQALYGDYMNRLKYSNDDHAIYYIPTAWVDPIVWEPSNGFQLQHAVVKELGYPKLETLEDYEQAIRTYMEKYPTINGEPTIGVSLVVDDWRWLITLGNPAGYATGLPDDGQWFIDPDTYEATYRFQRDEEKEYFRWLNHMYHSGLIDPDSFVQKYEAYTAKIASGRVLGLMDAKWQYREAEKELRQKGLFERTYGMYPLQLNEDTKYADFRDTGYQGGYGIGITTSCEDPVKAIRFLDYMASEEGQILRNWGVEGKHYLIDDQGMRYMTDEQLNLRFNNSDYVRETGLGTYVYPFPSWGVGVLDSTGNPYSVDTFDILNVTYSDVEREVLKEYEVEKWADLYPSKEELEPSDWGLGWSIPIPDETGITPVLQVCDEIVKDALIRMTVSDPDLFDALWNHLQDDLIEAGVEAMNEGFTELVQARVKLWSGE